MSLFSRADGVPMLRNKQWAKLCATGADKEAFLEKAKWLSSEIDIVNDQPGRDWPERLALSEEHSIPLGMYFARANNWTCENWQQYQILVDTTKGVHEEFARIERLLTTNEKVTKKMETTGLTEGQAASLKKWVEWNKSMVQCIQAMDAISVGYKRYYHNLSEWLTNERKTAAGKWAKYVEIGSRKLISYATPNELDAYRAALTAGQTKATAKALFEQKWKDRRQADLVAEGKQRVNDEIGYPPLKVDLGIPKSELDELLGDARKLPSRLLDGQAAYISLESLVPRDATKAAEYESRSPTAPFHWRQHGVAAHRLLPPSEEFKQGRAFGLLMIAPPGISPPPSRPPGM